MNTASFKHNMSGIFFKQQAGLSLVELMIAVLLGLILTAGAINIFVSNKATYRIENALARMQETGRFVVDTMTKDIRMAGYSGCASRGDVVPNVISNDPPPYDFTEENYILGSESTGTDTWAPALHADMSSFSINDGSDTVTVQRADQCSASLTTTVNADQPITVHSGHNCQFVEDSVALITDCESADIFKISNDPSTNQLEHTSANNSNAGEVSKAYNQEAQVFRFRSNTFYISDSTIDPNSEPAVWMAQWNNVDGTGAVVYNAVELAAGVEAMQIEYGIDTGAPDEYADVYMTAENIAAGLNGASWEQVRSVRIMLLLRSQEEVMIEPRSVTFHDTDYGTSDRRLRMTYTATVSIRNRLP